MPMGLYLLTQTANRGYDTYDSCVVVAASAEDARAIRPADTEYTWCAREHVTVERIGDARDGLKSGDVVCASFNAG